MSRGPGHIERTVHIAQVKRQGEILTGRLASDQKIVAERQWQQRKLAPKRQQQCDIGLFSDDSKQTDMLDLLKR